MLVGESGVFSLGRFRLPEDRCEHAPEADAGVLLIWSEARRMRPAPADDERVGVGPVDWLRRCEMLSDPRQFMAWFCMRKPRQEWSTFGR